MLPIIAVITAGVAGYQSWAWWIAPLLGIAAGALSQHYRLMQSAWRDSIASIDPSVSRMYLGAMLSSGLINAAVATGTYFLVRYLAH